MVTIDKPLLRRLVVCIEITLSEQVERFKPKDAETQAVALARVIGKGRSSLFETDEQDVPKTVSKEKAAELATGDFMTTFYHVQVGALETQEFRTTPAPFWLISFSNTIKGPMRQMYFVVLLPDGTVVVPRVRSGCEGFSV